MDNVRMKITDYQWIHVTTPANGKMRKDRRGPSATATDTQQHTRYAFKQPGQSGGALQSPT